MKEMDSSLLFSKINSNDSFSNFPILTHLA